MSEKTRQFEVGNIGIGGDNPLVLLAGVCVIEDEEHLCRVAERLQGTCAASGFPLVFKASYDKANRTSLDSYRGPGLEQGLAILERLKSRFGFPLLIDVHQPGDAATVAEVADILQIPAFLCRQTDLLRAAAATGRAVNVKKGQFLAPDDMAHVTAKLAGSGCKKILLTERGTCFGYHRLVNDLTALPVMRSLGWPVAFDATHSVQQPGGASGITGGAREFIPVLARAAVAAGCDAVFMEVHDDPARARSDAASVFPLAKLGGLLESLRKISEAVQG